MDLDLSLLLAGLNQVVADPAENLMATALLLAAAVVVILLLIVGLLFALVPQTKRVRRGRVKRLSQGPVAPVGADTADDESASDGLTEKPRPKGLEGFRSRLSRLSTATLVVILAGAALTVGYVVTSQDDYCASCHLPATGAETEVEADHAHSGTSCVSCHESRTAVVANALIRASDVVARYGWGDSGYSIVRSERCFSCHQEEIGEVVVDSQTGVAMSHDEPLDAGWRCTQCHQGMGHGPVDLGDSAMSGCLSCHDAVTASAECATCHLEDPTVISSLRAGRIFDQATITRTDCEGCHSSESCDACHGLRMPHPLEFLQTHPRYSGFENKELCFRECHTEADCSGCHGDWNSHGPNWKNEHKTYPKDSPCTSCHSVHEGSMCLLCHDF